MAFESIFQDETETIVTYITFYLLIYYVDVLPTCMSVDAWFMPVPKGMLHLLRQELWMV